MKGRKAIPINIKKTKGTYRKDRDKGAPDPSEKRPISPKWLNKRAKQIFWHMTNRLNELGLASRTNTEAIALLAFNMERVERFSKYLDKYGYTYSYIRYQGKKKEDAIVSEVIKERPEVQFLKEADRRVHSLLVEFGLTPASIQKVGTKKKKPKSNEFDKF